MELNDTGGFVGTGRAEELSGLAEASGERFKEFGELIHIDQAIKYYSQAPVPYNDVARPIGLYWFGSSHYKRFKRKKELVDIDQAILYYSQTVEPTPGRGVNKVYDYLTLYYIRLHCYSVLHDAVMTGMQTEDQ